MKQTVTNTKKSLGRVWSRYFQLYGVTSKLAAACMEIGWTQAHVEAYAKGHYHLVNQQMANMVKDNEPDVPEWGDQEWLASHPAVAGSGRHLEHRYMLVKRREDHEGIDQELWC